MNATIAAILLVTGGIVQVLAGDGPAPTPAKEHSTLDNLLAAYDGETNANAQYAEFAKKADAEGYGEAASLFRAAARSEGIHAHNHATVIRAMGGAPKANVKAPEVKGTADNLKESVRDEEYERDVMYPKFVAQAKGEHNAAAARTFDYARAAEATHARLFAEAAKNLEQWKQPRPFYVCSVCGYTAKEAPSKCPSCGSGKEKYEAVK